MCIIIDANCANDLANQTAGALPVLKWLLNPKKKAGLVVGGHLLNELNTTKLKRTFVELSRAGRLHKINDDRVAEVNAALTAASKCKSNDAHVVALVLASKCQLVFSRDQMLHVDLKANAPKGKPISIYQNETHSNLLKDCHCPT